MRASTLLVASTNKDKLREIKDYLSNLQKIRFRIIDLDYFPGLPDVIEDRQSFRGNALKKARERADGTGLRTLADDSGLVVDCLDGKPGIYSARYAGENATDEDNIQKLIEELKDVPREERSARFVCVMAIVDPLTGDEIVVEGCCEGIIELELRGKNGFGYDPIFYVPKYKKTMAELSLRKKNKISHRADALRKMRDAVNERYK